MSELEGLDPRTPVVVGVGEASERIDDPGYAGLSAVDLASAAALEALEDCGATPATVAGSIDTVAGVRQFENSTPAAEAPLGRSDNFPRSVARRVGAAPRRAILEIAGGQSPQHLVNELAGEIAAGGSEAALLFGAEAISTVRHLAHTKDAPDFTEHVDGELEDRGFGLKGLITRYQLRHQLLAAPEQYALLENARRTRLGSSREAYAREMGELFARFTTVAKDNPHAAAPVERSAEELTAPSERNRPISDPYPRFLVARDQVNQGAAVLLTSVAAARRLEIPETQWVFLHGHADLAERPFNDRQELGSGPASAMAIRHALGVAGIGVDDLATIDLYSCFPIAVLNICDELDLAADDPRGLTVTGGLPFFGGAGNNYSMHAIAETVRRLRATPGSFGLVGANGGVLSKYSAGVYSTLSVEWRPDESRRLQREIDSRPSPPWTTYADGWATIETWTVKHSKSGPTGIVVGRLENSGERFLALAMENDEETLDLLVSGDPAGARVFARSCARGNRVAMSERQLERLIPSTPPGFRDDYEFVKVRREEHLLEVVIDRPEVRNSLHPQANEELDEVFDAFFTDSELWVAILSGAGEEAFCAGNDLGYLASGAPMWFPKNGLAGLTGRHEMPKPVIAAINGYAMGGGLEVALACHLVVADSSAVLALSQIKVGLVPEFGGIARLPRAIPEKRAIELILTGHQITAREGLDLGLVNRVVDAGKALDGARALASEVLSVSPTAVPTALRMLEETRSIQDPVEAASHESPAVEDLLLTEDLSEGVRAYLEKRQPRWRNR